MRTVALMMVMQSAYHIDRALKLKRSRDYDHALFGGSSSFTGQHLPSSNHVLNLKHMDSPKPEG